ncbi:MAG: inositol monophosphatase [Alphaproteobacteria bacterium]|nr:MAG: inositol monophosphatase [Alphaproteobacteria bacterium]
MPMNISDMDVVRAMKLAAFEAGKYLSGVFTHQRSLRLSGTVVFEATEKGHDDVPDFVTQHDVYAEKLVRDIIRTYAPNLEVVGEEGEKNSSQNTFVLVDPCDGTKNFALGIPYFAVSIAYIKDGQIVSGVVCDPMNGDIYWAAKGQGAFLERIEIQEKVQIKAAQGINPRNILLVTEESYGEAMTQSDAVDRLVALSPIFAGIRKFGSTALDLTRLASGQLIAVVSSGIKSWDFAAGGIIAQEAGACLSDLRGRPVVLTSGNLIASPTWLIQDAILSCTCGEVSRKKQNEEGHKDE